MLPISSPTAQSRNPYLPSASYATSTSTLHHHPSPTRAHSTPTTLSAAEEYELSSPRPTHLAHLSTSSSSTNASSSSARPPPHLARRLSDGRRSSRSFPSLQPALQASGNTLLFDALHAPALPQSSSSTHSSPLMTNTSRRLPPHVNFTIEDTPLARLARRGTVVSNDSQNRRPSTAAHLLLGLGTEDDTWETARAMQGEWRRKTFLTMEEPTSSELAFLIHWGVTFLILFS